MKKSGNVITLFCIYQLYAKKMLTTEYQSKRQIELGCPYEIVCLP